jgi:hypothetical protein
MDLD